MRGIGRQYAQRWWKEKEGNVKDQEQVQGQTHKCMQSWEEWLTTRMGDGISVEGYLVN